MQGAYHNELLTNVYVRFFRHDKIKTHATRKLNQLLRIDENATKLNVCLLYSMRDQIAELQDISLKKHCSIHRYIAVNRKQLQEAYCVQHGYSKYNVIDYRVLNLIIMTTNIQHIISTFMLLCFQMTLTYY